MDTVDFKITPMKPTKEDIKKYLRPSDPINGGLIRIDVENVKDSYGHCRHREVELSSKKIL